jgi:RHS repeat-associated protein
MVRQSRFPNKDDPTTSLRTNFGGGTLPGSSLLGMHVKASLVKAAHHEKAYQKALPLLTPPTGQVWKSYYFQGSVRLALRVQVNGVTDKVYYLLADHLGSTTVSYRADGGETRTQSYRPWGELRGSGNSLPTDRTYSGQRWSDTIGLSFFNARWFDSNLGRFISADTIIPGLGNSQAWDRYAGLGNNPVKYTDPSGHKYCDNKSTDECTRFSQSIEHVSLQYKIHFTGMVWSERNKLAVIEGVEAVGNKLAVTRNKGEASSKAFKAVYGKMEFEWNPNCIECEGGGGFTDGAHHIVFSSLSTPGGNRTSEMAFADARNNIVHELGHAFAQKWYRNDSTYDSGGPYVNIPGYLRNEEGFHDSPVSAHLTWRQHPNNTSQQEIFADMFLGWTFNMWANNDAGSERADFMTQNMVEWAK